MKEKIFRISLGIRHQRSFRLPEIAGSIVDHVVRDSSFPLGKDFFQASDTILSNLENKGRVLLGSDNVSSMVIDTDSVILNLKSESFDKDITTIKNEIVPYVKKIFSKFQIENINRIGIVFEFEKLDKEIADDMTKMITANTFDKSDIFHLRLSHRDVNVMSLVKKDILDYANHIIAVSKNSEGEVFAKFDYQFYYSPEVSSIGDIDFNQFIDVAVTRMENKFFNWIKKDAK